MFCISVSENSFDNPTRIFPELALGKAFDINAHFVAAVSETKLLLHWLKFNDYTCYDLPVDKGSRVANYKKLNCVACHPTEAIVATGNVLGEVMIWWNLTTAPCTLFGESELHNDDDGDSSDESGDEGGHFHAIKKKAGSNPRPLHPKHVKRSGMHWHPSVVTALAFTADGKHLYSGGVEGVLVKWDLTDCFGGHKNCRFLSMLNSPIREISSPDGFSEDCVVVTLERNSFLVLNGALEMVYRHEGLDQMPTRWRPFEAQGGRLAVIPLKLKGKERPEKGSNALLLPGALGCLQVVELDSGRIVDMIDVNQRHYVMCDGVPAPLVSGVLLVDAWEGGDWLVTYSELQLPRMDNLKLSLVGYSTDNQAQLIWWRRVCGENGQSRFESVFGESLAYLNCQASDLKFFRHPDTSVGGFQTVLLLRDRRILVWQYNPNSATQLTQRPWNQTSCVLAETLNPSTLEETTRLSPSRLVCLKNCDDEAKVTKTREEAMALPSPRCIVVVASGTRLKSYNWIRWQSGASLMDEFLPLHAYDLTKWTAWQSPRTIPKIAKLAIFDSTQNLLAALCCSASLGKNSDQTGALCVISVDRKGKLRPVSGHFDSNLTNAFAVHPSRGLVAVGMSDGSCKHSSHAPDGVDWAFFESGTVFNGNLNVVSKFAQVPLLPFCDRQRIQRSNRKQADLASTKPEALAFLMDSSEESVFPALAALVVTKWGREFGRRDLVVYEDVAARPVEPRKVNNEVDSRTTAEKPTGLLVRAEPVEEYEDAEDLKKSEDFVHPLLPVHRKRRLETDADLEKTFRDISQYPIDCAPSPEQLLAQMFKKPTI
ncbi:unnamed protein product [Mesocestoides corti]|uniref:WD repeat-containing protein 75 n=1 Tax=Mesocestoides corti TaxID=53468 RepID=A0A0R3UAM8_MESCO|nr:unnamed protein product [Mesocestoides corti]